MNVRLNRLLDILAILQAARIGAPDALVSDLDAMIVIILNKIETVTA
jgi:hypothetical protein